LEAVAELIAELISVVASVQPSAFPEASTPSAYSPAPQLVPFPESAVAVPAFPDMEPVMRLENVLFPENVLALERSVEEAAVIVIEAPAVRVVPFTEPRGPER
jgi:hypothetical protein